MTRGIAGILLAAGQGVRFGQNKLLHPLAGGVAMAAAAARNLRAVLPDAVAVVDAADGDVARLLQEEGMRVVTNPLALEGMGTSIACGISASPGARGWLIALADMPYIAVASIRTIVSALERGAGIVAPHYRGQRGHPVGFSSRYADELLRLSGDTGARDILARHGDSLQLIELADHGVIADIDRPDELR